MKKLLLLGILMFSVIGFSETLTGTFVSKIHQISGEISMETTGKEVTIKNFTYDGNGKNVYIVLTKDGDFKNMKVISKELKKGYVNETLTLKVNDLKKLTDEGYTTVSVYTKTGKSSFGDASLVEAEVAK
ncbi:DM13 domain-containing protein [Sebaldella sp. S0638]|uniref:DM13 domain-containing protein n=1 Tax=Sebaldella sp. S0638 TaxID=2957809 RepID=UPI0020A039B5|nr:DM13 domain-containing protein [Sebaldella sp. S0638]MCP1225349.1 DM13 domain-containing protein [Sebaldella sp. S0638]